MKRLIYEKPNRLKETVGLFLQWVLGMTWISLQNHLVVLSKQNKLSRFACVHKGLDGYDKSFLVP